MDDLFYRNHSFNTCLVVLGVSVVKMRIKNITLFRTKMRQTLQNKVMFSSIGGSSSLSENKMKAIAI